MKLDLKKLRQVALEATPGPWGPWSANIPFNVVVVKPAPSLSKHDSKQPTYWRYEDGLHVLYFNPKNALELLDMLEEAKTVMEFTLQAIGNLEKLRPMGTTVASLFVAKDRLNEILKVLEENS